jgi:hypothetical protein
MQASLWSGRGALATAVAAALAIAALGFAGARVRPGTTIDLYQFWAIGAARSLSVEPLPTPWADAAPTRRVLKRHLDDVDDPAVRRVHAYRMQHLEPFASPLLYALFAPLPNDYATAVSLYRALQLAAFGAGVLGLAWLAGWGVAAGAIAVALLALGYGPFGDDLFTGNLNALQLGAVVGVLALLAPRAEGPPGALRACLALSILVALVLVKPNFVLVCAALAVWVAVAGVRGPIPWIVPLLVALSLVVATSLWFGSARAWPDWLRLVFLDDPRRLSDYAVAGGNSSTPRLLHEWFGLDTLAGVGLVSAVLLVSVAAAGDFTRAGVRALLRAAFTQPALAGSFGLLVTTALLPLAWFHYFVWMLIPLLWLLLPAERSTRVRTLAGTDLLLYSGVYVPLLAGTAIPRALATLWAVAWIIPWTAFLLHLREVSEGGERWGRS